MTDQHDELGARTYAPPPRPVPAAPEESTAHLLERIESLLRELDAAYAREEKLARQLLRRSDSRPAMTPERARPTTGGRFRRLLRLVRRVARDPRLPTFARYALRNPRWAMRTVREKVRLFRRSHGAAR